MLITDKNFWKAAKSFLTNKGWRENSGIILAGDKKMISDEKKLLQLLTIITLTLLNGAATLNLKR